MILLGRIRSPYVRPQLGNVRPRRCLAGVEARWPGSGAFVINYTYLNYTTTPSVARTTRSCYCSSRSLAASRARRCAPAPFHVQERQGQVARGRDGTKYSKYHPENYLSHHLSAISMAAVYADACHIDDGVTGLKQDAHVAGSSDEE